MSRTRTRHQVTLSPRHVDRVRRRVAEARAAGYPSSFSAELERAVDEADGNLRSVRHQVANDLHPALMAVELIKRELRHDRRLSPEDVRPIEDAIAKAMSRLKAPTSPPAPSPLPSPGGGGATTPAAAAT